jgi:hypothetical protein
MHHYTGGLNSNPVGSIELEASTLRGEEQPLNTKPIDGNKLGLKRHRGHCEQWTPS